LLAMWASCRPTPSMEYNQLLQSPKEASSDP
jgi:hypothetical protein